MQSSAKPFKAMEHGVPDAPFEYHFMDEAIAKLYTTELQLKSIIHLQACLQL